MPVGRALDAWSSAGTGPEIKKGLVRVNMHLRPMTPADKHEVGELIYCSINTWYRTTAARRSFRAGRAVAEVFYDVYEDLDPGCNVVAEHPETGRLMGSCFYHPRQHHVSLGVMTVHPNHAGMGVGRALLQHIMDYTDARDYQALRLTQSAINVDSFRCTTRPASCRDTPIRT